MSRVCSFVSDARFMLDKIDFDIYNPEVGNKAKDFIQKRMESYLSNCIDCELVAICKGGCVCIGFDKENELNEAACLYIKEIWKEYLLRVYGG